MNTGTADGALSSDAHAAAAEAFVDRTRSRYGSELVVVYVFGSTARGEARGLASDVDVLVVLEDDTDREVADGLRDIAYDVMLEYGPVVELHVLRRSTFEQYRTDGHPFVRNVTSEGHSYG